MLKILGIDKNKCIKCEKCVPSCSVQLYDVFKEEMEKNVVFEDPFHFCFRCGHCIAVCPTEAIMYEGADPPYNFKEAKNPAELLSYENYMKFIRSRRSVRVYKNELLSEELLERIIEAMRYSPSASNRQNRNYIVLTKPEDIQYLSTQVSKLMLTARRLLAFKYLAVPFTTGLVRRRLLNPRTKISLDRFLEDKKQGKDRIFFNAPCVIILHAPPYSKMTASDAAIAISHGMLAAHSLGLGTCWIGFAQEYLWRSKKTRRKLGIPKNNNVYGVFIVGHPDITFLRAPPRREARVERKK